jgi:cyclase
MKKLRYWLALLFVTLLAVVGTIGWHTHYANAQMPTSKPTLASAGLTLQKLGSGVYGLISSTDFPKKDPNLAICNAGIVIGSDGALIIDPFQTPALGNLLFETAKGLTDQPIRYVVNTHYHFDHTGGNAAAAEQGIPIVGRGPIRNFMITRNQQQDPNPTPPTIVVDGETTLWLGDRQVQIEVVEGHSSGTDLIAYVPDANVLFAGDILFNQRIPYTADGDISQWRGSLDYLLATYPSARMLPGHGPVTDRTAAETLKQYFNQLEQLAIGWKQQGLTEKQAIANAQLPAAYRNYKFQALHQLNLQTAYQQFVQPSTP